MKLKQTLLLLIGIAIISRGIYTATGILTRAYFLNASKPFPSWTYASPHEWLNIWTNWDSGVYYQLAQNGYPNNRANTRFTLQLEKGQWARVFLGATGKIGTPKISLPTSFQGSSQVGNTLYIFGDSQNATAVPIEGVSTGVPYCIFTGQFETQRDVYSSREYVQKPGACGETPCHAYVLTYIDALTNTVTYQEQFTPKNSEPLRLMGSLRPTGFSQSPYEGLGCKQVADTELLPSGNRDIANEITPYPFFPLFPLLTGVFAALFGLDPVIAGLFVSNLSFVATIPLLFFLMKQYFKDTDAEIVTLLFILLPTGFFFSAFLTEGLYMFLFVTTLLLAKKRQYLPAAIVGALLAVTRINGIFVSLPLLWLVYTQEQTIRTRIQYGLLICTVTPLLLLAHCYHLFQLTGDALAFSTSQQAWGKAAGVQFFEKILQSLTSHDLVVWFELVIFALCIYLVLIGLRYLKSMHLRPFPHEWTIISIYSLVLPLLSGSLASMPRYMSTVIPVLFGLLALSNKYGVRLIALLCFSLSICFMSLWVLSTRFLV